ncbi:MAG: hypothetical protein A2283_22595 [Lentisphaerae bacterium RIFOXYA12_FULL_48_11]|nr:MAG: hypothetical protein A2283_22595 [Lentisphaerae bacterium RIFOXYA12_FULL_48_11]
MTIGKILRRSNGNERKGSYSKDNTLLFFQCNIKQIFDDFIIINGLDSEPNHSMKPKGVSH